MEGFPGGALAACEGGGLEESVPALWGVFRVYFRGIGLGRHEDSVCPVEDPPLGVRFEDVDGRLLGGGVQGVPRCDGQFYPGGVEVWGCPAAQELIVVEGGDGIFGALRWWGHRWHGCGVPVAFVGGEGVQGGGDDVVGLPLQDDVALRAEVLW